MSDKPTFTPVDTSAFNLSHIDLSEVMDSISSHVNNPVPKFSHKITNPVIETNKLLEENNKSTQRSEYELNKINAQFRSLNIEIDKHNETINRLEGEVTSLKTSLAKLENPHYWLKNTILCVFCVLLAGIISLAIA